LVGGYINWTASPSDHYSLLIARVGETILQYGRTSGIPTVLWSPLKPEAGHQQGAAAFVVDHPNQAFRPSPFDNAGKLSSLPHFHETPSF
jgi:hypothetical protein